MNQKVKKIFIITLLYIGLMFVSVNKYAANTGKTTNETTRLRKEANTTSETLDLISIDTDVTIVSEEGEWYKVSYNNHTGYIRKDMLEVENATTENSESNTTNESTQSSDTTNSVSENTAAESQATTQETTTETSANTTTEESTSSSENNTTIEAGYTGSLSSSLDLRLVPSIISSVVSKTLEGESFTVKEVVCKWCYIETNTESGWVFLDKINTAKSEIQVQEETTETAESKVEETNTEETKTEENATTKKETTTTKYVSAATLNVREKAENDAKIVVQLALNAQVTVVETIDSSWTKVSYKGKTGYVASKYLSDTKSEVSSRSEDLDRSEEENKESTESNTSTATESSTSSTTGANVVSYAKQFLGCEYVSGGMSPITGFDCSGFTSYVYKHFGITLNRVSSAQASNGTAVSKSDLKMGDLVLFKGSSGSSIGHVGIYIGGNAFIHAANPSKGVITTSLSDSYYSARYVCARRIIN